MSASQIRSLTTDQLGAMSNAQLNAISAGNIAELTLDQIAALTDVSGTNKIDQLTNYATNLTADQKDVIRTVMNDDAAYALLFP